MVTNAVGIDLGTTFSAIAIARQGIPEIIPNMEGERITPSVILFDGQDVIVGTYARQAIIVYPDQVVEFVKRHMGDDAYAFEYGDEAYTAERLSSFILAKLKHDAEERLGQPVEHAVITVPAYFGDKQRRATMMAGEMAGFHVLKLINEPTAAAFAFGLSKLGQDQRALVFDLGGGTFDVTIVDIAGRSLDVLATNGDHQLGGKDWDDILIAYIAEQFKARHGLDPLDDVAAYQDLRQKCVSAKISLSRRPKVNIFYDHAGRILRQEITRELFEDLTAGLMGRVEALTKDVLEDARLRGDDIDTILLAGGSTRMPMVRGMVERLFGRKPTTDLNPDECVALGASLGAALAAAELNGEAPPIDMTTQDVTSHSLGMVVFRDEKFHNSRIVERNTRIPCERTREDYVTTHDAQTTMDLWLVQGENADPLECSVLGHFEFYGIPARPAGESRLSVTYRYNVNGIVEVEAMDILSGQTLAHRISAGQVTLEDLVHKRLPMQIALLVDCSGSMYGPKIEAARRAASSFIRRALKPGRQIALIAFPGGVLSPPVGNAALLEAAIAQLTPIGATPLSGALRLARDLLPPRASVARAFLILTDGHPDDPESTVSEALRIRNGGGRIITVGVGREVQKDFLKCIVSRPSDFHFCDESFEIEETFINLATELA
jgi:molecular chaperone DnaK (HSP70)